MHCHCGTNNRAPRWTFTDPCKPEVRPGAREESASPAWRTFSDQKWHESRCVKQNKKPKNSCQHAAPVSNCPRKQQIGYKGQVCLLVVYLVDNSDRCACSFFRKTFRRRRGLHIVWQDPHLEYRTFSQSQLQYFYRACLCKIWSSLVSHMIGGAFLKKT